MSSDRELTELAAKAAGLTGYIFDWINGPTFIVPANPEDPRSEPVEYDWRNDDGDALRLAVKLRLCLFLEIPRIGIGPMLNGPEVYLDDGDDEMDATRLAIVRAAAEIGKSMP